MIAMRSGMALVCGAICVSCASNPGPTPTTVPSNGITQGRVRVGSTFRMPSPVSPNRVRVEVPAIDARTRCRVLTGVPQPGVAQLLILSFDSTTAGMRNVAVGLGTDGTVRSYSDVRGDLTDTQTKAHKSTYRNTSISINFAEQRSMVTNRRGGTEEHFMVLGPSGYSAENLGNPNAMIERARTECANVPPQTIGNPSGAPLRAVVSDDQVRRLSSNVADFKTPFPAIETSPVCIDLDGPMKPGVAKSIIVRFRTNGIPQRMVSIDVDSAGKPLRYQDTRSADLTKGGPMGSANTSISFDFVKRRAQLSNMDGNGGVEIADVDFVKALDADNLGVPILMMDRVRKRCELP